MRLNQRVAGLAAIVCLALPVGFAHAASAPKSGHGTLVIVFKDGHRQSYNLSEIERVEFPAAAPVASAPVPGSSQLPSRARFLGRWEVGEGNGSNFIITLKENGDAVKSIGDTRGRWVYVDGEAQITWDDGWQDAIRKVGASFQKFAYRSGKSFTDTADNVAKARNTTPHPI